MHDLQILSSFLLSGCLKVERQKSDSPPLSLFYSNEAPTESKKNRKRGHSIDLIQDTRLHTVRNESSEESDCARVSL